MSKSSYVGQGKKLKVTNEVGSKNGRLRENVRYADVTRSTLTSLAAWLLRLETGPSTSLSRPRSPR